MATALKSRSLIVTIELRGPFGGLEFTNYLARLDQLLDAGEPFAMIVDGSRLEPKLQAAPSREWLTRAKKLQALHRGVAFVIGPRSPEDVLSHDRVRALCILQPPGVPYAFVDTRSEAQECVQSWLDALPAEIRTRQPTMPIMAVRS